MTNTKKNNNIFLFMGEGEGLTIVAALKIDLDNSI